MKMMTRDEIYMSAIGDGKGEINVGYLVLFRSGRAAIIAIFMLIVGSFIEMAWTSDHAFNVQALGVAIGAIIAAYGVLLGALGGFLWGDAHSTPQSVSTVTRTDVKVGEAAPAVATSTVLAGAPQAGELRNAEFLAPKIGTEDVGKSVALIAKTKPTRRK